MTNLPGSARTVGAGWQRLAAVLEDGRDPLAVDEDGGAGAGRGAGAVPERHAGEGDEPRVGALGRAPRLGRKWCGGEQRQHDDRWTANMEYSSMGGLKWR